MKNYIEIKINKDTIASFAKRICYLIFVAGVIVSVISGYNAIRNSGYNEGYEEGYDTGRIELINYTMNAIREDGYGYVSLNGEYEYFYDYSDPCDPRPEYCDWELNNSLVFGDLTVW